MSQNALVCTQLNGFKHCYLTLIILLDINHLHVHSQVVLSIAIYCLHTVKWFQVLLFIVFTQFRDFKYFYLTLIALF